MKSVKIAIIFLCLVILLTVLYSGYVSNLSKDINELTANINSLLINKDKEKIEKNLIEIKEIWENSFPYLLYFNDHADVVTATTHLSSAIIFAKRENYETF